MDDSARTLLQTLPKVDRLLENSALVRETADLPRSLVVEAVREELDTLRARVLGGHHEGLPLGHNGGFDADAVARRVLARLESWLRPSLRRVYNATGVVLHTNLGRAPLGAVAIERVAEVASGYCNLEYDIDRRARGSRHAHLESLLCRLTGAEAALVVNNCAAAVLLLLAALARGREVIVSRGELIEIGGSFRLPDVMEASGAALREVGTTNRTRLSDYEAAIGESTALLLKAHRSNFAVVGFTEEVSGEDLARLGRRARIPTAEDLGSGLMVDLGEYGLGAAPTVPGVVASGIDLVTFSGDKLLGGPQAGVIVGRAELVGMLRRHPLARALRVGKLTLAALEATLLRYLDGSWRQALPALRALTEPVDAVGRRATALRHAIAQQVHEGLEATVVPSEGRVGGGALPLVELPSRAVRLRAHRTKPEELERRLRRGRPPVIARIDEEGVYLDCRTLADDDVEAVAAAVARCVD